VAAEAPPIVGVEAPGAANDAGAAAGGATGIAPALFRMAPLSTHVQLQVSFLFVRPFVHVSQSSTYVASRPHPAAIIVRESSE
jgi:hypothetical protein